MLLGHSDGFKGDKDMKVTIVFNRFGPNVNQRMPRVRFGLAHVANNLYQGWGIYAMGGGMKPTIISEANYFIATKKKEVTWRDAEGDAKSWIIYSIGDIFDNGATFAQTGEGGAKPDYNDQQAFSVADANVVKALTSSAGIINGN